MPKIWVGRTALNGENKEDGFMYSFAYMDLNKDVLYFIK